MMLGEILVLENRTDRWSLSDGHTITTHDRSVPFSGTLVIWPSARTFMPLEALLETEASLSFPLLQPVTRWAGTFFFFIF